MNENPKTLEQLEASFRQGAERAHKDSERFHEIAEFIASGAALIKRDPKEDPDQLIREIFRVLATESINVLDLTLRPGLLDLVNGLCQLRCDAQDAADVVAFLKKTREDAAKVAADILRNRKRERSGIARDRNEGTNGRT